MTTPATSPTASPALAAAPRERGWWRLLVGVIVALSVPIVAQLRVTVPIEQTILLIGPAMAACALVSWIGGGRLWMFAAWGLLALWMLLVRVPGAPLFDQLVRGWSLILAAAFALVSITGQPRPFLTRALMTLAVASGLALLVVLSTGLQLDDLGRTVASEFSRRLNSVTMAFEARANTSEWQEMMRRFPGAAGVVARGEAQLPTLAAAAIALFPALLALESLAVLALAWSLFHRSSRTRIGAPLKRLAEFRFNDQLVWGMILGITLMILPTLSEIRGVGTNLVVFFGALYALRGLGVLSWFLAPGKPTPVWLVVVAVVAGPVVGVFALGLGVVDTWIDWRGRLRPAT